VGGGFHQLVHRHEQAPVLSSEEKQKKGAFLKLRFVYENQILKVFHFFKTEETKKKQDLWWMTADPWKVMKQKRKEQKEKKKKVKTMYWDEGG